jgi:glucokinase
VILAGDVGATKILLQAGAFRSGRWTPAVARRYLIADFDNFHAVIARFLEDWDAEKPARARITSAAIGAAGPLQGNTVTMTHRAWKIDSDTIFRRFGIPRVRVLNDLAAAAHGLESMTSRDMVTIQPGKSVPNEPRVVLGVGTGLGVAYLVPSGNGFQVVPGEGGHVGFSPAGAEQAALWQALFAKHGRVEAESLCSGMGLTIIPPGSRGTRPRKTPAASRPSTFLPNASAMSREITRLRRWRAAGSFSRAAS